MARKKFKPTKGEWKVLRGNYGCYASINASVTERICTVDVKDGDHLGSVPSEEAQFNIQLLAAAKENFEALERIHKEVCKALEKSIVQGKRVDFKKLVGQIGDFAGNAIRNTKKK